MRTIGRFLILLVMLLGLELTGACDDIPKAPPRGPDEVGVAVLSPQPTADAVEQKLRLYLGSLPGIDYLIEPDDPDELFRMLAKLTRDGKKVRYLVIAGHGNANAPNIKFRKDSLRANNVDLAECQKRLTQTLQLNALQNRQYDNPGDQEAELDINNYLDTLRPNWRPYHAKLDNVSDVMAAGGEILLLNCSAAATPAGKTMCRNLGRVLLGKRGGSVIASTVDIQIDQAVTWFSILGSPRTGKWVTAGDLWVSGNWLKMDIPAGLDPFLFVAFHETALKKAQSGQRLEISPQVDARRDSGKLLYSWNGGPPSSQASLAVNVEDNPRHRLDLKVSVQDSQGRIGEDTFTIRIEGVQILGGDRTRPGVPLPLKSSVFPAQKGLTYRWSSPTGSLGEQANLQFVQSQPGRYPVTLEVSTARGRIGSDSRTILVEEATTTQTPPTQVERTTVTVNPLEIMASDFFDLSCQLPAALQSKVKRYEWLVQAGSGEGVPATSETSRVQIQLLRQWVGSNFGVRLYDARGNELDVGWARLPELHTRQAQFSLSHPDSWSLTRAQDGALVLDKKPTLNVKDSLKESEGEASYSATIGGGSLRVDWLSSDELPGLGQNLPHDWIVQGDVKQKGAVAYRAAFKSSDWAWPNSGGPRGSQLAGQLTAKYQSAVAAHRDYTAKQVKDIIASLKLTPQGEVTVVADAGPPADQPGPQGSSKSTQAAELIRQAKQALAQGQLEQTVSLAQQAVKMDAQAARPGLADLTTELSKQGWDAGHIQDFGAARSALQAALKLSPGDPEVRARLAKVERAAKAWPRVQQLGQQVDELIQQRRLTTAYPILGEVIRLANDLLYKNANMHPYADAINRRYHARSAEWDQLFRNTSSSNPERLRAYDYEGVLASLPALEEWELTRPNRLAVDGWRQLARNGLEQQTQDWNFYHATRSRYDNHQLARTEYTASQNRLRGALNHFPAADERRQKIQSLIDDLNLQPLEIAMNASEQRCQLGQPVPIAARVSGGSPPYSYQWFEEGRPMTTKSPSNDWKFANAGRFVVTVVVTDARQNEARANTVVSVSPAAVSNPADRTSWGTSYPPGCHGDPFEGGTWNNGRNGNDWLQRNFSQPRRVAEIRIEQAGTDVTTEGSSLELQLHTPEGNWVTIDRLQNTNINWEKLTGGGRGRSIPSYAKILSPPVTADAVRLNLSGNGWFVVKNVQILSKTTPVSAPPRPASQQVVAILRNESQQNVHIFAQGDSFGPHNRLAPGEERQLRLNLPADGRIRFSCGRNGQVLGSALWNGDPDHLNRYPQVRFTREQTLVIFTGLR